MHLLRNYENFFPSFLSPWLLKHHTSPMYQDTMVYCRDKVMLTNRLVFGLLFPQLASWEGFTFSHPVEVILPEWDLSEVEKAIQSFFGDTEVFEKGEQIDNFDDEANSEVQAGEQYLELKDVIETKITTNTP